MADPLQTSGYISLANVDVELSRPNKIIEEQFFGDTISMNDGDARVLSGVLFGTIAMSDFYGKDWAQGGGEQTFTYEDQKNADAEGKKLIFTVPPRFNYLSVTLSGGGGGGAGGYSNDGFAYGYNGGNGGTGGSTKFGNFATAFGGTGGFYPNGSGGTDGVSAAGEGGITVPSEGQKGGGGRGGNGGWGNGGPGGLNGGNGGSLVKQWTSSGGGLQPGYNPQEFTANLFLKLLHRDPDSMGMEYWMNLINSGYSRVDIIRDFLLSTEYTAKYAGNGSFIKGIYVGLLNRYPDPDGYIFWIYQLSRGITREVVVRSFLAAAEFNNSDDKNFITYGITPALTPANLVTRMYSRLFLRKPDSAGLTFHVGQLDSDSITRVDLLKYFLNSDEYNALYPVNQGFVESLYVNLLMRMPDPDGYAYWFDQVASGTARSVVIDAFMSGPEFKESRNISYVLGLNYEAGGSPKENQEVIITVGKGGDGGQGQNDAGHRAGDGENGEPGFCTIKWT